MGIETRVHNLWNNLIESASHATGSLLIWDTGEYEVLPRPEKRHKMTDDEMSEEEESATPAKSQSEKLFEAFQSRHIRLRLHGTRLPPNYTVALRLPSHNNRTAQPKKPKRKRRRIVKPSKIIASDSDSEPAKALDTPTDNDEKQNMEAAMASKDEGEVMRINNAYPGSFNTIGSVHQRHWFITLDRTLSGFRKENGATRWTGDWEAFNVLGREHERSVVTGRLADEVMADDGVEKFVGRKMWRPIIEQKIEDCQVTIQRLDSLAISSSSVHKVQCLLRQIPCLTKCLAEVSNIDISNGNVSQYPPFDITFPSAHHSPSTVNKNASEFVIGTVRLNSTNPNVSCIQPQGPLLEGNLPACPISKKNHTLPVTFNSKGTA